jgi:hypothetical protein
VSFVERVIANTTYAVPRALCGMRPVGAVSVVAPTRQCGGTDRSVSAGINPKYSLSSSAQAGMGGRAIRLLVDVVAHRRVSRTGLKSSARACVA